MSGVFLSYASERGGVAERVYNDLRRLRIEVWRYERDGEIGVDFEDEISRIIERSSWFLLIDSSEARASDHVREECRQALGLTHRPVAPLRFLVALGEPVGSWREQELFQRQNTLRFVDLTSYDAGIRKLCIELGATYVPEFAMPHDTDFVEELYAAALQPVERDELIAQYRKFRRRYDASRLRDAEDSLRSLLLDCEELDLVVVAPRLALAVLYGDLLRDDEAIEAFRIATHVAPNDPRGWAGLGSALAMQRRYAEALDAFRSSIKAIDGSKVPAHLQNAPQVLRNAAFVAGLSGLTKEALQLLDRADASSGATAATLALRGQLLLRGGAAPEAEAILRRAIRVGKRESQMTPGLLLDLADCLAALGDTAGEGELVEQALRSFPGDAVAHRRWAVFNARIGQLEIAIDTLRTAIALEPASFQFRAELALVLRMAGRAHDAAALIDWCRQRSPSTPSDRYYQGLAYYLAGDTAMAREARRLAATDPIVSTWDEYRDLTSFGA